MAAMLLCDVTLDVSKGECQNVSLHQFLHVESIIAMNVKRWKKKLNL